MSYQVFDVSQAPYSATGNGSTNDYAAIQAAINDAQAVNGCVYFPAGVYLIQTTLSFQSPNTPGQKKISFKGDGPNISVIKAGNGAGGLDLIFAQSGIQQPWGAIIMDLGFRTSGTAGTAIKVSYGSPSATNDHFQPSLVIRNVEVRSDQNNYWSNGVDITSAWNVRITDCYISGRAPSENNWSQLSGAGIALHRSCVNSHFVNCHVNFWATAFLYDTGTGASDHNTEGLFFANCSFVAVLKGVHIAGNPNYLINGNPVPRVSGVTWTGGIIELRAQNTGGGSAAFHLINVNEVCISSTILVTDTLEVTSYGVFADTCNAVSITGCNVYSFAYGFITVNTCKAIVTSSCTFVNCANQVNYSPNTTESRSFGHVRFNNAYSETDQNGGNKLGWV